MGRIVAVVFCLLLMNCFVSAQTDDSMEAIMRLTGAGAPEDMDSYEVERLSVMLDRKLRINDASAVRLASCGLFSRYQIASIMDYKARHGDILSFSELATLDGFGKDLVDRISPFISLYSSRLPGERVDTSFHVESDLALKCGLKKINGDYRQYTYGVKYRSQAMERVSATVAASRSTAASGISPDAWSASLAWAFKRMPARLVVGDFNARFGQGLALWNGMTMSGLASPSAFMRASSGISQSWSFTGSAALTGMASELYIGKLSASVILAVPGAKRIRSDSEESSLLPAVNLTLPMRNGHIGITHYAEFSGLLSGRMVRIPDMKSSADLAFCIRGTDVFAESAYDWVSSSLAFLAGTRFPVGESMNFAAMIRWYPSSFSPIRSGAARSSTKCTNERAVSVAGDFRAGEWISPQSLSMSDVRRYTGSFSFDAAYFPIPKDDSDLSLQLKAQVSYTVMISGSLRLKIRLSERIRSWGRMFKTDFRTDFSWFSSKFEVNARVNALKCVDLGIVSYVEGLYRNEKLSVCLRVGAFCVDDWDDRIYVYERDAPGSFNVPALYGRGSWVSATASWKFAKWGRLYLRASEKLGNAELKLQCVFSF